MQDQIVELDNINTFEGLRQWICDVISDRSDREAYKSDICKLHSCNSALMMRAYLMSTKIIYGSLPDLLRTRYCIDISSDDEKLLTAFESKLAEL